ncbi:MAG: hypothetical protein JJE19_04335 [Methanosarcinales archaeon]|nr:hypothetical protein [Methanosarcinales archaeon]
MPLKITLRKDEKSSPLRQMLNMLLQSPAGDSAILCSGYIWQPTGNRYNILDDGLRSAIVSGCNGGTLTTVAGKFSFNYYKAYYRNFILDLRSKGVNVVPYYAPKKNWHAKIAIRMSGSKPVAALVGSSNLTGPAYGLNRNWNFEADVLIWTKKGKQTEFFRDDGLNQDLGRFEVILDLEFTQLDEEDQLEGIDKDVMDAELERFE